MGLQGRLAAMVAICAGAQAACGHAAAQSPPPAGFSLEATVGPAWNSNPLELNRKAKGDIGFGAELVARYRWALWEGATFTLAGVGFSEVFFRDSGGGINRLAGSATFSQRWQGANLSLVFSARTATSQHLTSHDSASQDLAVTLNRPLTLAEGLTLTPAITLGRRFHQDGTEHQFRSRFGLTLMKKWRQWSFRAIGGYGWALEDKTPILPRINDRTMSATLSATYEWEKDRELALKLGYSRTLSSYGPNRTRGFTLAPQLGATIRY